MPIFEYICLDCKKDFDKIVSQSTEVKCPECESKNLEKKLSHFSFSQGSSKQGNCQDSCAEGFNKGCCGSGMCPGQ